MKLIQIIGRRPGETLYQAMVNQNGHCERPGDPAKYVMVSERDRRRYINSETGEVVLEVNNDEELEAEEEFMWFGAFKPNGCLSLYKHGGFLGYLFNKFYSLYEERFNEYEALEKKAEDEGRDLDISPWFDNLPIPREWVEEMARHAEELLKFKEADNLDGFKSYIAEHLCKDIEREYDVEGGTWREIKYIAEDLKRLVSGEFEEFFIGDVD